MHMRKLDTLLNSLENGHMVMDDNFTVKYWNIWLCINTQISAEEIIGKSLKEFYPDLNYHVLKRKIKTALALKTPAFYDANSKTKFIPIDRNKVSTSALTLMQQQVTITPYIIGENLVMISLYDISELHETKLLLKKEIEKVNQLNNKLKSRVDEVLETNKNQIQHMVSQSRQAQMGEMISMIAHQWRQPLSAISATAMNIKIKSELESFDLSKEEEAREYETFVNSSIYSINGLVQVLSKTIDDFRYFFAPNKIQNISDINGPIKKSLDIIKASIVNEGISIHELYESKITIPMYDSELMQVFLNIIKNSQDNFLDKSIKNPAISIKTYDKNNTIMVEISDNGGGIKEESVNKIFEPYFSTKGKNGTGLGLYMSKTIIEEHHDGELYAENKDNGVCFCIKISKPR